MGKWDPYSRRELRNRRARWLRRNEMSVSLVVLAIVVAGTVATWSFSRALSGAAQWYVIGVMHAGLVVGMLHLLNSVFLASDREAIWHVRGAWGEDNTRSSLARAKRRRLIWDWVDSISFQAGDLDHLVVTRNGGLVAIDSKWCNEIKRADTVAMAQSALKAQRRAEALARTLLAKERGTHRARVQSLTVTPVVVVWGAAQSSVPKEAMVDGVRFLVGRELVPWLRTLDGDMVPKDAAKDVLERSKTYRAKAWQDA